MEKVQFSPSTPGVPILGHLSMHSQSFCGLSFSEPHSTPVCAAAHA